MTIAKSDLFSVDFFDLQLRFARRVAELSEVPFVQAVGSHTNLYVRLGMGATLDVNNPDWQDYLAGLVTVTNEAEWTHSVHVRRLHIASGPEVIDTVGCFSYALIEPDRARLHFHARPCAGKSPLAAEHLHQRRIELRSLISRLRASSAASMQVVGASWLYNLQAYRSLFPEQYLARLKPIAHPYQRMPLWGQLLTRDRRVRHETRTRFLDGVTRACRMSDLGRCFPFAVLTSTSPAEWFCDELPLERFC